jgi:hypothetical protein
LTPDRNPRFVTWIADRPVIATTRDRQRALAPVDLGPNRGVAISPVARALSGT